VTSRLASLLVQENIVGAKKMAEAFQRQVIYGGTLDTILLEMDIIDEGALVEALGRASQLPTAGDLPSAEALQASGAARWFPHSVCERYRAVPISLDGNVLRVLVTDPPDRKQLDELGYMLSLSVDPIIVPEHRFMQAVELVYHVALPARFQSLSAKLRQRSATVPSMPAVSLDPTLAQVADVAAAMTAAAAEKKAEANAPAVEPPDEEAETPVEKPAAETRRAVVTDVPMPVGRAPAAPEKELPEAPTPRLTTRQLSAPAAQIAVEVAARVRDEPAEPSALPFGEALSLLERAGDRDAIFESLCRGARSQLGFVALFTVQNEQALGRMALGQGWVAKEIVSRIVVPLDAPSPLSTTTRSLAPFLGRLGDEAASQSALEAMGRPHPTPALLAPVVLRERTVALLYGDNGGKPLDGADTIVAGLSTLTAAAARAFQRLILKQKGGEYSKGPSSPSAKLGTPAAEHGGGVGAWRESSVEDTAKLRAAPAGGLAAAMGVKEQKQTPAPRSPIHELPTQQIRQLSSDRLLDMDAIIASVLVGDDRSRYSADSLVALGEQGALAVVARMPGPLKLARHTLRGPTPPLAEHGPLLALVSKFGKTALGPLLARLNDASVEVRYYATLAVGELKAPEAAKALGLRLLDSDTGVRAVAIQGLARFGDGTELRVLMESLRGELPGPDPLRQEYAAEALGALRDPQAVPRLIELVKHPDASVVLAARHALTEITKQDFGTSRWRWRSWWERHRNEPRLEWMLEGLGHPEAEVRESASEELRSLSTETFGYHFDLPKREREEARRKWIDWWRARGTPKGTPKEN
jgi:Type II secretion system (T2SS), protein E, N-terminal domain/HEAT repeats/PBS lyase HEAT-like repeat